MATSRKTKPKMAASAKLAKAKGKAPGATRKKVTPKAPKPPSVTKPPTRAKQLQKATEPPAVRTGGPATVKARPRPTPAAPVAVPPPRPTKPPLDLEELKILREILINQANMLKSVVQSTQAQMAEKVGWLPDVSDRASEGSGDELAAGLLAIETARLDDIEAATRRIDDGSYGLCMDCGKAIPKRRLEILPFALRCLACKGVRERGGPAAERRLAEEEPEQEEEEDRNERE